MTEASTFEHDWEQMRIALAQTLLEELDLNVRDALELADHFYGPHSGSVESGVDA